MLGGESDNKDGAMRLQTLKPRLNKLAHRLPSQPKELTGSSWRSGKTSTERGYGYKWQQAREGYLRLHPLCVMCDAEGKTKAATVVDHIVPHEGDQVLFWNSANWQSLCATHHSSDKQRQERSGRVKRGVGPDGWPVEAGD